MSAKYPFKNLVFHSGGVRAFAYHGALPVLEEYGILPQIERVAGASAGAMTAAMVSFRLSAEETVELFRTLDFSKIPEIKETIPLRWGLTPPAPLGEGLGRIAGGWNTLARIGRRYGVYGSSYPYNWMSDTIASQCDGDGRATFADFRRRGFCDLYILTTNISTHKVAVFSADTTPDAAVVDALLMSQSIPLFFEAPKFDGEKLGSGDYYGDGGLLNGFPLQLFDELSYAEGNDWFIGGINWETLGCHLHAPEDEAETGTRRQISSVVGYISNIIELLIESQNSKFQGDPVARRRTIDISNCGVPSTEFNIRLSSDDEKYVQLVEAGETATRAYLAAYQPPNIGLIA